MRVFWQEERRKFLRALGDLPKRHRERNKAVMLVAYDTGCRVSELVALDVADYDDQRRTLHLINVKAKDHPKREVPIHAVTARALRSWLKVRPDSDNPAMFLSQKKGRLSARQIQMIYDAVCRQAGIEAQGIHTLRHTMATRLLDDHTLDVHQVSRRLGHRDIITTYKYYVHGDLEAEAKAINNSRL